MKIYKGDVGTIFRVNIGTDISGMSWGKMLVFTPNGDVKTWVAIEDPEDNTKIRYVAIAGDLDEVGLYRLQSHVKKGWILRGDTAEFQVHDVFE